MNRTNAIAIESNINAADATEENDAWSALQERAEMDLVTSELNGRNAANARNEENARKRLKRGYNQSRAW